MNDTLLLIISLFAALLGSIVRKYYMDGNKAGMAGVFVCNAVASAVSAVVLLVWGGFGASSTFTLILGTAFGLVTALQAIFNLAALALGPMSYTTVIVSFSTVITALSGKLFFGENIYAVQIIGIVLMLVSFVFAVDKKSEEKSANLRWLIVCGLAFIFSGGIGIMQKIHQTSSFKGELNAYLVIAFVASTVVSAAVAIFLYLKGSKDSPVSKKALPAIDKRFIFMLVLMIINGVSVAVNHKLNLYLSGVMDSATFFPIVNGGGLVLSTVAALIIFRERLSVKQWIGLGVGILSVIFLCNPF